MPDLETAVRGAGDVEAPDELARLVSAVERMAEGIGDMLGLVGTLAPTAPPAVPPRWTDRERMALESAVACYLHDRSNGRLVISIAQPHMLLLLEMLGVKVRDL